MNKRQRKKHRRGEFQELGFALQFRTPDDWPDAQQHDFWVQCIGQIEALGLVVGGGTGVCWNVFVTGRPRHSVTVAQRQALLDWLKAHWATSDVHAGPLQDAWHEHIPPRGAAA